MEAEHRRYVDRALVVYTPEHFPLLERIHSFALRHDIELIDVTHEDFFARPGYYADQVDHVVTMVTESNAVDFIDLAKTHNFSLGLVPLIAGGLLSTWFKLPQAEADAIRLAFENDPEAIDVLRCNGEITLGLLTLGETPFLNQRSSIYRRREQSQWRFIVYWLTLFWLSFKSLFAIKAIPVTLDTGKKTIKTAITGLVAIENDVRCAAARMLDTPMSVQDHRISTLIIAPKSIVQYVSFLFTALSRRARRLQNLPAAVSFIKSSKLEIQARQPIKFYVDGRPRKATSIELIMYPGAVRINMSDNYHQLHDAVNDNKDTMRIEHLPQSEERVANITRHLPFFTHAQEDDFRDLFIQLRDSATATPHYLALMVLSSLVASLGLFLNSAAVIIGAMILAPLMAPLVSMAMAALRADPQLIKQSLHTIAIGIGLSLLTSAVVAFMFPIEDLTNEIQGRIQPALLDLWVAIFCGIAGAYAYAHASVMRSLPGVAIAVALVPPLCVTGIGLGWGNWQVVSGAGLMFLTNLIGVIGAAAITFMVLGFAPIQRARRGLAITATLLLVISIPLYLAFASMQQHWHYERFVSEQTFELIEQPVRFVNVSVNIRQRSVVVSADSIGPAPLSASQLREFQAGLETRWERSVSLDIGHRYRLLGSE